MPLRNLPDFAVYLAAGAVAGLLSAVVAIDSVGSEPAAPGSIWLSHSAATRAPANPYALAHYLLQGRFPSSTNQTHEFLADRDGDGNRIHADCTYAITGTPDPAHWWNLSGGSGDGGPVPHSTFLTSSDAVLNSDGTLTATLSRLPRPGNWIRPQASGRFSLIYTVAGFAAATGAAVIPPFSIKQTGC